MHRRHVHAQPEDVVRGQTCIVLVRARDRAFQRRVLAERSAPRGRFPDDGRRQPSTVLWCARRAPQISCELGSAGD